jgi:hypothetical protein
MPEKKKSIYVKTFDCGILPLNCRSTTSLPNVMSCLHDGILHVCLGVISLLSVEYGGRAGVGVHVHCDIKRVYLLGSRGPLPRNVQTNNGHYPKGTDIPANGSQPRQ